MPDEEFLASTTIGRYASSLSDLPDAERERRLQLLADFATFVERAPDEMIAEIFNEQTRKYRKRGFYTDKAKEFAASRESSTNAQLQCSNVIRGFFIANGRRLLAEKPSWMSAS